MNELIGPILGVSLLMGQPVPPQPEAVLDVPPELSERIQELDAGGGTSQSGMIDRLADFFRSSQGLDFEYSARPTRSVADTYATGEGNCLAFTLTFIAVARQLGLDAYPREVNIPDQWQREGAAVLSIGHVNIGVDTPDRQAIVDFEPDFMQAQRLSQPFRGRRISDERALAHFYNNRAAELIIEGQQAAALAWVDRALTMDEGFAPAWITSGVLERRHGRLDRAEQDFLTALEHDERSFNALVNLVSLQRETGDRAAMVRYGERLEELAPKDPYLQWELGRLHSDLGALDLAHRYFRRAVRLSGGDDPTLLASLAQVLHEMGKYEEARHYLTRSLALTPIEASGDIPKTLTQTAAGDLGHPGANERKRRKTLK